MRIALVQVASPAGEPVARRRARVAELVADAAGSDLVVLPELWAIGYFAFDSYQAAAEPADGPTTTDAAQWARDLHCHILAGSYVERDDDGRLFNTTALIGPDGTVLHRYRKVHVFGYQSREAALLTPGDEVSAVPTPFGSLGATTCYDLRFPEIWRGLVGVGAELVVTPAAWPQARLEHWRLFTQARAVEEQILLIACNAVGEQGGVRLGGHSRVIDPWGTVLAEAGQDEGITTVEVDPRVVARTRASFPVLGDRYEAFAADGSRASAVERKGTLPVRLRVMGTGDTLEVAGTLIIAGYTGSDADRVREHIKELAAIGVPQPPEVPMVYPVDWSLLTTAPSISVAGSGTSGEVEPVLVRHRGAWYLGVGSDHTDREVERESVHESKKACPKPMADTVIALGVDPMTGAYDADWKAISLTSGVDGVAYQRGSLAAIRMPSDLLPRVLTGVDPDEDLVVFCGTVPILDGEFRPGWRFDCRLAVPGSRPIDLTYTTRSHRGKGTK
ncbi:nitrilase-related carbon-nitrogen hydrolase [Streptomyces sp. 6N223]|uniref:nitrilase-related carbon-nitrogen hydrolase n=1 Tax=Streptomyces sp. 6N223 TaxID=3457412 RepID=UPI003FD3B74B